MQYKYALTHYTTAATQKRANIVQAVVSVALNKKLQKYNKKHNTNYVLHTSTYASTCNTCVVVNFTINATHKHCVKLFNKTVKTFYKFKCCNLQHYCNISSNSYVVHCKTNAQVY